MEIIKEEGEAAKWEGGGRFPSLFSSEEVTAALLLEGVVLFRGESVDEAVLVAVLLHEANHLADALRDQAPMYPSLPTELVDNLSLLVQCGHGRTGLSAVDKTRSAV